MKVGMVLGKVLLLASLSFINCETCGMDHTTVILT